MALDLSDRSGDQLLAAGRLAGRRLLERGLELSGRSRDQAKAELERLVGQLAPLQGLAPTPEAMLDVEEDLRAAFEQLSGRDDDTGRAMSRALDMAENASEAQGWGGEASLVILSIGFAISLLLIASQVGFRGKVGPMDIEKLPGFPKEIVQVVGELAKAAGSALANDADLKAPRAK